MTKERIFIVTQSHPRFEESSATVIRSSIYSSLVYIVSPTFIFESFFSGVQQFFLSIKNVSVRLYL